VVILEAMSAGLPVIATRIGAMPDLVEEGRSGHLVPPGDPGALEQALLRLVEDAELRRRMGERGRERAVTDFSWDGVADRVARLILAELD
jgi:glycosyltransferase involved in cell wall biosynthesis